MNPSHYRQRLAGLLLATLTSVFVVFFGANSLTRFRSYSPDSMNYVDVARNVLDGRGLVQSAVGYNHPRFLGYGLWVDPFVAQPPLYPIAITALGKFGIEPADGALILPTAALGGILLVAARIAFRLGGMTSSALTIAALVWYSPLIDCCRRAWSDALGAFFVLCALLLAISALDRATVDRRKLSIFGAICGFAFATRYALAILLPLAGLVVLIAFRDKPRACFRSLSILFACMIPLPLAILVHNFSAAGCLLPPHNSSMMGIAEILRKTSAVTLNCTGQSNIPAALFAAVVLTVVLVTIRAALRRQRFNSVIVSSMVWSVAYIAFVIWQRWRIHFDEISPRLLLPALIPLVLVLTSWVGEHLPMKIRQLAIWCSTMVVSIALGRELLIARTRPPIETTKRIEFSPRLVFVRDRLKDDDLVIGNDPVEVAFYLRHRAILSFSPFPYTDYPSYLPLLRFIDSHTVNYRHAFIVIRDFSHGDDDTLRKDFGPFIFDLLHGECSRYPRIHRVGLFGDTHVFKIDKVI